MHWVHVHPRVEKKKLGPNLQEKFVSAPPGRKCSLPRQSKSPIFEEIGEIWAVGEAIYAVLACVLRATTKKSRQLFGGRKLHPDKILATPMIDCDSHSIDRVLESLAKTARPW